MNESRFSRNIAFFGREGQQRIRSMTVAVVGVGGLGSHVVQQLALLGVGGLILIDSEEIDESNRNRYVGVLATDPVPGSRKVDIGERLAHGIDPSIDVRKLSENFICKVGFNALKDSDAVFGCVDNDGARLVLNEFCSAYVRPYFDLASDVVSDEPLEFGGRVLTNVDGDGCLVCMEEIDPEQAGRALASANEIQDRVAIYGVDTRFIGQSGPSVVSINGVVASLATTEFMVHVADIRRPEKLLIYRGQCGIVTRRTDGSSSTCWYCSRMRGRGEQANVERYCPDVQETLIGQ